MGLASVSNRFGTYDIKAGGNGQWRQEAWLLGGKSQVVFGQPATRQIGNKNVD